MKKSDKNNIKNQSVADLKNLLKTAKSELFDLTMDLSRNKLKNTSSISTKRKDIARLLTAVREKELLNAAKEGGQSSS